MSTKNREVTVEEGELKVGMDFITKLRAEANRQKAQKSAREFAKMLGNNGEDIPDFEQESMAELDKIANSLEITEE
jgi:hypothetical protein